VVDKDWVVVDLAQRRRRWQCSSNRARFRLSGVSNGDLWTGVGEDTTVIISMVGNVYSKSTAADTTARKRPPLRNA